MKSNDIKQLVLDKIYGLMVEIPEGVIEMRDDRIEKRWVEKIHPFSIAKFPVTQALYFSITGEFPGVFEGYNRPVESVSWIDAVIFCNEVSELAQFTPCYSFDPDRERIIFNHKADGFRLPTEAEWQYACQAGTDNIRYGDLNKIAWYKENSNNGTRQVGQKDPNEWGLYDMLGNVWEWCSDVYDETVYGRYRIFRGGGWNDDERSVMATTRRRSHPGSFKIDDLGFRIARNTPKRRAHERNGKNQLYRDSFYGS